MRISRFFVDQPLQAHSDIELPEDKAHYLGRVLRMQPGQELILFDGRGGYYPATLLEVSKKAVKAHTAEQITDEAESPLCIHLGIALSKGEKFDWVIQKATELGVSSITPLASERSDVRIPKERQDKRQDHWQQVAISACEQCGRNRLPQIKELASVDDWCHTVDATCKFVLHHRASHMAGPEKPGSVALLIGPEGGLSCREITLAESVGFEALRLGPRILRTETAPVAALAVLQYLWGDLG